MKDVNQLLMGALSSFILGLTTSFSGCLFPVLPMFVAYLARSEDSLKHCFYAGLSCAAGITVSFMCYGAVSSYLVSYLIQNHSLFNKSAGVLILLMAILNVTPFKRYFKFSYQPKISGGVLGAFIIGFSFALIAAPCAISPIVSVLLLAATASPLVSVLYMVCYGLGAGIPFIAVGGFLDKFLERTKMPASVGKYTTLVSSIIMAITGIYLISIS